MGPAAYNRDILAQIVVVGIAVRMEIPLVTCKELLGMLRSSSRLVFVQHDGVFCISTGSVQPYIAITLRFLVRFVEHLQCSLICMEHICLEQFLMQLLIYGLQVVFRGS
jgi:hypothetical protein